MLKLGKYVETRKICWNWEKKMIFLDEKYKRWENLDNWCHICPFIRESLPPLEFLNEYGKIWKENLWMKEEKWREKIDWKGH